MSDDNTDISRDAVERKARELLSWQRAAYGGGLKWAGEAAPMLRALRDALDAAEAERDALRKELLAAQCHAEYAVAAEREACARVADAFQTAHGEAVAKGIRARGEGGVDALAAALAAEQEACARVAEADLRAAAMQLRADDRDGLRGGQPKGALTVEAETLEWIAPRVADAIRARGEAGT